MQIKTLPPNYPPQASVGVPTAPRALGKAKPKPGSAAGNGVAARGSRAQPTASSTSPAAHAGPAKPTRRPHHRKEKHKPTKTPGEPTAGERRHAKPKPHAAGPTKHPHGKPTSHQRSTGKAKGKPTRTPRKPAGQEARLKASPPGYPAFTLSPSSDGVVAEGAASARSGRVQQPMAERTDSLDAAAVPAPPATLDLPPSMRAMLPELKHCKKGTFDQQALCYAIAVSLD